MSATKEKLHDLIEKGMKQTAVDWLKPQIELILMDGHKSYPNELEEVFEIAKEMEKQQQGYSEEDLEIIEISSIDANYIPHYQTNNGQFLATKFNVKKFKNK